MAVTPPTTLVLIISDPTSPTGVSAVWAEVLKIGSCPLAVGGLAEMVRDGEISERGNVFVERPVVEMVSRRPLRQGLVRKAAYRMQRWLHGAIRSGR